MGKLIRQRYIEVHQMWGYCRRWSGTFQVPLWLVPGFMDEVINLVASKFS